MNKDNAREYLPLVQALAEGKTIQRRYVDKDPWEDVAELTFTNPPSAYRIKPEPVKGWYRVALMGVPASYYTYTADRAALEINIASMKDFIRWLTDRIEYEVEA